jgi:hypothetical protein
MSPRLHAATPLADILEDQWDAQLFRGKDALAVQLGWTSYHTLRSRGSRAGYPDQYDREDLQIPKIDGQSIDRIKVKFGGEIHLDRSDPADVKLYNELKFGRDVAMLIEGRCNKTGAEGATDREGDLDVVIGQKA